MLVLGGRGGLEDVSNGNILKILIGALFLQRIIATVFLRNCNMF